MKAVLQEKSTHIHVNVQWKKTLMVCLITTEVEINWTSDCTQLYFVESIRKISCLQTELAAIVMEDFIHFLQAAVV